MANPLDEITGPVSDAGRDTRVIEKQLPVTVGAGSLIFEIVLWTFIPILVLLYVYLEGSTMQTDPLIIAIVGCLAGMLPGLIFLFMKVKALNYFQQLEQRIQTEASNIDNYLEQRVIVLQNVVGLVNKAIQLDTEVMTQVAALRGGTITEANRNQVEQQVTAALGRLFPQVEAYPELKAHQTIADAMQQNNYLQREITAARTVYNNRVDQWNTSLFQWPTKMIVAAKQGYTTRIPFITTGEIREQARGTFF